MESCFNEDSLPSFDDSKDEKFPVQQINKIMELADNARKSLQEPVTSTHDQGFQQKEVSNGQSQYKNVYGLLVFWVLALLNDRLKEAKNQNAKAKVLKTRMLLNNVSKEEKLKEFELVDKEYSELKKQLRKNDQNTTENDIKQNKEKEEIQTKRKILQEELLEMLEDEMSTFIAPAITLINEGYITSEMINRIIKAKNEKNSKSWTTLDDLLQDNERIGLLILNLILGMLSEKGETALTYWSIQCRMDAKNKEPILNQDKRVHVINQFKEKSLALEEKIRSEIGQEHLKILKEISGDDQEEYCKKKQIKK